MANEDDKRTEPEAVTEEQAEGRDKQTGRFTPGNHFGQGRKIGKRIASLRAALIRAVTPDDMETIALMLIEQAREGNLAAMKLLFDRVLGPPVQADIVERMESMLAILEEQEQKEGITSDFDGV